MKVGRGTDSKVEHQSGGSGRYHSGAQSLSPVRASFADSMENMTEEMELQALLDHLDAVTLKLSVFPAEGLLMEYKSILRELLKKIMKGFNLRRDLKWRRSDRATYVTVEKAEAAMAELEQIFSQESNRTRTLQLLEEIKGCLISLLF
ncbi:MAG: DUF327 family protein [Synergistaceae bacterium]|jgi:uncharacterized protein YaaR (DUF327 family)|nr:DUF327 family protein [Synergistaceae bacterium]